MRVQKVILALIPTGVVLACTPSARPQDATSANLPERVETGEIVPTATLRKKQRGHRREIAAATTNPNPTPEIDEKPSAEELPIPSTPVEKKRRVKTRTTSAVQPEPPKVPAVTSVSLPLAQSMAVNAPLPEYPYEAKHANVTGSGICVMIVDTSNGKVTNAMMAQSTGNAVLDKVTTEAFRRWRFKPGTVSQVRVPITYE